MTFLVVIVSWNGETLLGPCLESVLAQTSCPDVCVVDNASTDQTPAIARQFEARFASQGHRLELIESISNLGFTLGANLALTAELKRPAHEAILLLNQDTTLGPGCLEHLTQAFERDASIGIAGCKLFYPDGVTLQHAGGSVSEPRLIGRHDGAHEPDTGQCDEERGVNYVTGAVMALRVTLLQDVGVFNPAFAPGYYEDVDLCLRAQAAGWRVVYVPNAVATHVESASFTHRMQRFILSERNRIVFALPRLTEPEFAVRYLSAEQAALTEEPIELVRARALGALEVLTRFSELAALRLNALQTAPHLLACLGALREACVNELQKRRRIAASLRA